MATTRRPHPLVPLSAEEINVARGVVAGCHDRSTALVFRTIELQEPARADLVPFLAAEHFGTLAESTRRPPRLAKVQYNFKTGQLSEYAESIVDIELGKEVRRRAFPHGTAPSISIADIMSFLGAVKTSELFKEALAEFRLPENFTLTVDPWPYGGPDEDTDDFCRIQALVFARDTSSGSADSNHYAYPIPLIPVFDVATQEIVRVDRCATGGIGDPLEPLPRPAAPRELFGESGPAEYVPELLGRPLRTDLKGLDVTQPDGPSFAVGDGNLVEWQKWRFRVGFTWREGAVLHDVTYDHRPVLYRLSVSEMTVPYADPRPPFHRKQAFDFGDGGVGGATNDLQLGCDCLGRIHYFGAVMVAPDGIPGAAPNRVCLHEQDGGILWKHTNFSTKRAVVVRMRELVVQFVATLGNYEYVFAYRLDQAGGIAVETRATGVVSVAAIDYGKTSDYGTVVQNGILAQNHQHLIALRIDPAIDSYADGDTGVLVEETRPVEMNDETNPFGNAYRVVRTPVADATWLDAEPARNRIIHMVNWNKRNPASGRPVGYKFAPSPSQLLLADPRSRMAKRALFAKHHVWVTGYRDGELWAAGEFTNLSKQEAGGVADMVARHDWFLDGPDAEEPRGGGGGGRRSSPVVWNVFGLTHNPRVEDWPVMPAEIHTLHIKPADFFDSNPALDVPGKRNAASALAVSSCCAAEEPSQVPRLPDFAAARWQGEQDIDPRTIGLAAEAASLLADSSDGISVTTPASSEQGGTDDEGAREPPTPANAIALRPRAE